MNDIRDRTSWRESTDIETAVSDVRSAGQKLDDPDDLDRLVERFSDRKYVLIGEASHGTSEFYRWRSRLTARLIQEQEFSFVAVEGDWTDCYEANRYVKDLPGSPEASREVLKTFDRWPNWMWANWEVLEFLDWLAVHNQLLDEDDRIGFFGLDVYSLFESLEAVVDYLEDVDPDAAAEAREAYRCFEPYGEDAQEYAQALRMVPETCEDEVIDTLTQLQAAARRTTTVETTISTPNRTHSSRKTPNSTTERWLEATLIRGTSGTDTWSRRSSASRVITARIPKESSGHTTRTSATLGRRIWNNEDGSTSANSFDNTRVGRKRR